MFEWFKTRENLSLYWDTRGFAFGILSKTGTDGMIEITEACESTIESSSKENLKNVLNKLNPENKFYTVAGASLPGEIFFELKMPKLSNENLKKALDFELPRQIPWQYSDLVWSYIPYELDENFTAARIWIFHRDKWSELQNDISEYGVKADCFISPYMCSFRSQESNEVIFLPNLDKSYFLVKQQNGLSGMVPIENTIDAAKAMKENFSRKILINETFKIEHPDFLENTNYYPAFMIAINSLNKNFKEDKKHLPELQSSLIPQRFREWKLASVILITSVVVLLSMFFIRTWYDARTRLMEIRSEKNKIVNITEKLKNKNASNKEIDATIKKIFEASSGNAEILKCLHFMTEAIPESMWLAELNSNNDKIDLALKVNGDIDVDSINWDKSGILCLENIRKRRNNDSSTDVFVKLTYNKDKSSKTSEKNDKNKVALK